MGRLPTYNEMESLVTCAGVKRIAVENFLMSLDFSVSRSLNLMNLKNDAVLYRWNAATIGAILRGIDTAYGLLR